MELSIEPLELLTQQQAHTLAKRGDQIFELVTETVTESGHAHMQTVVYRLKHVAGDLTEFEDAFFDQLRVGDHYIRDYSNLRVFCKRSENPDQAAIIHQEVIDALKNGSFRQVPELERLALGL